MSPDINMNALLASLLSLAMAQPELWEKGSVCGSDTFIGFLLGFSLPEPGLMFTLISQTDHPRHILMSLPVLWRKICEGGCGKTH